MEILSDILVTSKKILNFEVSRHDHGIGAKTIFWMHYLIEMDNCIQESIVNEETTEALLLSD